MSKQRDAAMTAAQHHTTLAAFATVTAILESGVIYDHRSYRVVQQIIKICHAEQQRQLARFDREMAKVATKDAA